MEKHYGQIVEYTIRKNGQNISELAKRLNVNRRTIYNWFNQPYLNTNIIHQVGLEAKLDFSVQFPELFTSEHFHVIPNAFEHLDILSGYDWKEKYVSLLEKYNKVLLNVSKVSQDGKLFILLFACGLAA